MIFRPDTILILPTTALLNVNKSHGLFKLYYGIDGVWSDGYFVSTVGVNERTIARYVRLQGLEDSGQAELEL